MLRSRRETANVPALLRNILDNYPAGSATIREFLQNTDDCGATTQTFILDTRTFSSDALVDPALAICQGPAIIAVNDGYFLDKDWQAITDINISSKKSDENSTGKYGLGFRSCYHITDNPQILSGDRLLILDAHQRIEMHPGGVEIPMLGNMRHTYRGHFDAFDAVLSPDDEIFKGTAIRLPLRLDASHSDIKSTPTDIDAARQMLWDFLHKDLAECMLFLKHITDVHLIEVAQDGSQKTLGRAWIDNADVVGPLRSRNRGRDAEMSHHQLTVNVEVEGMVSISHWIITHFVEDYHAARKHLERRLDRESLQDNMAADKLLPHVAIAFPNGASGTSSSQFAGRLFTLLPLPIFTGFPLHVNAVLALTSSRQNLRGAADAVKGSREELLVEWNRIVFSELVPKAWAAMFQYIASLPHEINLLTVWPPFPTSAEGDRMYWQPLPTRLLEEAAPMAVWPVQSVTTQSNPVYHNLSEVLVASETSEDPVSSLKICGAPIITPPASVHALIKRSASYRSRLLTPAAVHPFIKRNVPSFSTLDAVAVKAIADYLATGAEVRLLYNLPLFLNCKGGYTSLLSGMAYTFATDTETTLFQGADSDLLKLNNLSPATRGILLHAPAGNLHVVRATDVAQYVFRMLSRFRTQAATTSFGVKVEDTVWLVRFWNWVNTWAQAPSLFNQAVLTTLQPLYLIPLDTPGDPPKLRKLARGVMDGRTLESGVRDIIRAIDVPILHPHVALGGHTQNILTTQDDITFILENLDSRTPFDQLDQKNRSLLSSFLAERLSPFLRSGKQLSSSQQKTLRTLPIFPVLPAGSRPKSFLNTVQNFGVAPSSSSFVDDSVQVVPSISGKSFLDGRRGAILAQALGENAGGEMEVLALILEPAIWAQQQYVKQLSDLLINRLVRRLNDFDHGDRTRIAELPIVMVGASGARIKPSSVVDPKSKIACLYDVDDGVMPHGRDAEDGPGTLLQQFRSFGMLRSSLSESSIVELITKLGDHSRPFGPREQKALLLLPLLDDYAMSNTISSNLGTTLRDQMWLPADGKMNRPEECWDSRHGDAELCDFVLPLVPKVVNSRSFRDALAWENVPWDILQEQLVAVVKGEPKYRIRSKHHPSQRIIPILRELSKRFQALEVSDDTLAEVLESLQDLAWVPVARDSCCQPQQTMFSRIALGTRFHRIYSPLAEEASLVHTLKVMGVCDRPSPSALLTELQTIEFELAQASQDGQPKDVLLTDAVAILHEISQRTSEFDLSQVLVLDEWEEMRALGTVIYNDRGFDVGDPPAGSFFAHQSIARSIALDLGLRQLSDEEFDREDDIEAFDMGEDLSTRVQTTLNNYDIEYASNEWVANADDANASTIKFILHEGTFGGKRLLTPDMKQFQELPSLVIYNDGVFSEKDFEGIRNVGIGGKGDTPDTIGRFGLGAFSFYHFTDLVMLVSAGSVVFLDPSRAYLPRQQGVRRSGFRIPLKKCRMLYPDQLKPLDGMFGFDLKSTDYYQGTLFRLPLRTASQAAKSKLSSKIFTVVDLSNILHRYFRTSTQSMFFSKIKSISALRRAHCGITSTMWCVEGSRRFLGHEDEDGISVALDITNSDNVKWKERWLVCMSRHQEADFPADLQALFRQHRLPPPVIGIALNTSDGNPSRDPNFQLFATLPLPVSTSLPAHVHATWILSDDRRSLRYDFADGSGRRPLDAKYNEHILQSLVPPLYLRALSIVASRYPRNMDWCWPTRPTDAVSRDVSTALYAQLKDSKERVVRTTLDEPIALKDGFIHVGGPEAVGNLLAALDLQDFVGRLPFDPTLVEEWDGFRTDNAKDVADLLRDNPQHVRRFYETDPAKAAEIDKVLKYLLKGDVTLNGVPLLQLGDGRVTSFTPASGQKVFCSSRKSVATLFGRDQIIGRDISQKTVESLCTMNLNVQELDVEGLRELLRAAQVLPRDEADIAVESRTWYQHLLKFLTSDASPVKLEELEDLPLIPVTNSAVAISLSRAHRPGVWWQSYDDQDVIPVLRQCNIHIVHFENSISLRKHTVDLAGVLGVIGSSGIHRQLAQRRVVSSPEWGVFSEWMKRRLNSTQVKRLSKAQLQTLGHLPLFSGRQGQMTIPFVSASNITMLPAQIPTSDIARYLPNHIIYSLFSHPLHATLEGLESSGSLTMDAVIDQLNLPDDLPPEEDTALHSVIDLIYQHRRSPTNTLRLIPDENRTLQVPSTLYDYNVAVFRQSFHNRPENFIHPNFRNDTTRLVRLGVHRTVTPGDIVNCAKAIDQDSRTGSMNTRPRAEFLWHFINDDFDARHLDFNAISDLRFVPSNRQRHPMEPQFSQYGRVLPEVLSLNELCLKEHAQTVWTQRATFAEPPSAVTMAIFPQLGIPTIHELVDHLVVLATIVAIEHPGSRLVLSDIRHTYASLRRQAEAAKPILLRHRNRRIWLNVDDPVTEDWVWRSAEELIFDLLWDKATCYDARGFLKPYREMLIGSGAKQYSHASWNPSSPRVGQSSHADTLMTGWQDLRSQGLLFDIQFVVEGQSIRAHRGVLAAVVPHFRLAFTAGFRESQSLHDMMDMDDEVPVYPLAGDPSLFAIQSVIDYIYTGKFTEPPLETTEESEEALDVLLELFELAHFWELDVLKTRAAQSMVELKLLRAEICDDVMERAQRCDAPDLVEACRQNKANNQWI